ncbi:MAG: hypothetical protein CMD14_03940 [Flavobacteriales bacterium]|nr:hypothetical protein [Flavobacteriales bacterium]|tara:strand:- start:4375 stop:4605 length:231 start_codon:yes stop_codon:yes gene_type:complete
MESQDIYINTNNELEIDTIKLQKMAFIYNAVESGWKIHKQNNSYVFSKKHEGKKEIYLDNYLKKFLEANFDINKLK